MKSLRSIVAKGFRAAAQKIEQAAPSRDELMINGEKYRGQGIRFRPPYASETVSLDAWLDEQSSGHTSQLKAQA